MFKIGDMVYVTNSNLYEGLTRHEINKKYKIIRIEKIECTDAELYSIELEETSPFSCYLITNFDIELED